MKSGLKRGMVVTTQWPTSVSDGSHRAGWTWRTVPAGTPLTVIKVGRWAAMVQDEQGGTAALPKGLLVR